MIEPLTTLAFWTPGPLELIIIGILGVLIFGKRLPEVGKSIGKGIVEFKKGLSGVEDQLNASDNANDQSQPQNHLAQSSTENPTPNNLNTTSVEQPSNPQPQDAPEPRSAHPST